MILKYEEYKEMKSFGSCVGQGKVSLESSDPPGLDFVEDETEELGEDHCSGMFDIEQRNTGLALQRCKSASELPLDQKFDIRLEGQMEGDSLKEKLSDSVLIDKQMLSSSLLLEEHNECNQTVATTLCLEKRISSQETQSTHCFPEIFGTATTCNDDTFVSPSGISTGSSNLIPLAAEIRAVPVQDKMANTRSFSSNSMKGLYLFTSFSTSFGIGLCSVLLVSSCSTLNV